MSEQMAVTGDGTFKPVSEFTPAEKWWCTGEECYGEFTFPHTHPYWGPERRVDLLTGKEISPGGHGSGPARQPREPGRPGDDCGCGLGTDRCRAVEDGDFGG